MTKQEAQNLDLGHVYVSQKSAYQWQVLGNMSGFLYAEFAGPLAEQEAERYADDEYNSYHDDGKKVEK